MGRAAARDGAVGWVQRWVHNALRQPKTAGGGTNGGGASGAEVLSDDGAGLLGTKGLGQLANRRLQPLGHLSTVAALEPSGPTGAPAPPDLAATWPLAKRRATAAARSCSSMML